MTLDQLRYFLEASRQEHLGRAAERLNVTPSTLSQAILSLENEFGVSFFERSKKRIFLNTAGKLFAARCDKLLSEARLLHEEFSTRSTKETELLRISVSHDLVPMVASSWATLNADQSSHEIEIFSRRSAEVVQDLVEGKVDLGICYSPLQHPSLASKSLRNGNLVPCVRKEHPLLKGRQQSSLAKLTEFPAALPKAFAGIEVCVEHPALKLHSISPERMFAFDSYTAALALVLSSNAWGLLPDIFLNDSHSHGRLAKLRVPLTWKAPYSISAVWKSHRKLFAMERELIDKVSRSTSAI